MAKNTSNIKHYYAHGKLLLTGEYLVLKGAQALALPLQKGQSMKVSPGAVGILDWKATVQQQPWFGASFRLHDFSLLQTNNLAMAGRLKDIFRQLLEMQPDLLLDSKGLDITTNLEFNPLWGWGSSSTLLYNLAQWAKIDPFELNSRIFKGSGYDIACAGAMSPLLYQLVDKKPLVNSIDFQPAFSDQLFFVWLNNKQNSENAITHIDWDAINAEKVDEISSITRMVMQAQTIEEFGSLLDAHEKCLADILLQPMVRKAFFPDFPGILKSLGAWGGDFILAVPESKAIDVVTYFKQKGYHTVFKYTDIVNDNR